MSKPANRVYEFRHFRLETAERLLLRDGKPIPLTPKTFETLLTLVQNTGRLVTKDDLMKELWPGAVVEEANVARNIWMLRKALANGSDEHCYIETVPKLGYRFVAPVREVPAATGGRQAEGRESPVADEHATPHASLASAGERRPLPLLPLMIVVLVAVASSTAAVARFWRNPARSPDAAPAHLTDGSHDDSAAYRVNTGRIYFSRAISDTRIESWTMNADGSQQRRANLDIPTLLNGRWSPDGRKVVFVKEGDPGTAYLADASGANEIVLPFMPGNMDWSPDGSRFVYQLRKSPTLSEIFVYMLDTGQSVSLTPDIASADPSFSPDGRRIAFTSFPGGNAEIHVMEADGTHVRRVTNHPAFDNYPVFSPDGTQIAFQSNREDEHFDVYLQNLNDDSPPRRLTRSSRQAGFSPKCWSADGTQMLIYSADGGRNQIRMIDVDPLPARLLLSEDGSDLGSPRPSADGTRLLYEAQLPDRRIELRVTEMQTGRTKRLFSTETGYPHRSSLEPVWSADNAFIAFSARDGGNSEVMVMNADGSGSRNLTKNPFRDTSPTFSPDGREIVFTRDQYGQGQLYRMDADGSNQRRVTPRTGHEIQPAFSPDGTHLAFAGDRDLRGMDIMLLDLSASGAETVLAARRSHDQTPAFSPDGRRIVFVSMSDGNPEIYAINSDGTGLVRVTRHKADDLAPQFSQDGRRIIFSSNRGGRFAIYQIDLR